MIALLLLVGCFADDYDPDRLIPLTVDTAAGTSAIVGTWRSEGADLSDLFAGEPFDYVSVETTFAEDGSYAVHILDAVGQEAELVGTWTVDEGGAPATITLDQTSPYEAVAEGLWAVDGDTLTYEVVQTEPDYGFNPPQGAFGTSTGPGLSPDQNVQIYRRVE